MAGIAFPLSGAAQSVALDPAMGGGASVGEAANGVPVVNIASPGGNSSLSHNKFLDFNVGGQGLIFNNSLSDGQSSLGGHTMKNPHLDRPASGILTEVTGTNLSRIEGAMEVFGQKADLLIANPNGLYVNGVATINANSLVLTTGTPWQDGARFDVQRGHIELGDIALDGLTHFDVVARSIELHGVVAGEADATLAAGLNRYDARTREVAKLANGGGATAPKLAIEGSALGAMYGRHVQLISTESGVGVRHDGLVASAGDIRVSADGDVTLREIDAGANAAVSGRDIALGASNAADASISRVEGELRIDAARDLDIAGDHDVGRAQLHAGRWLKAEDARLQASRRSTADVAGIAMTGRDIAVVNSLVQSADDLAMTASNNIAVSADGRVLSGGSLEASAGAKLDNAGQVAAIGTTKVTAGKLKNAGAMSGAQVVLKLGQLENAAKGQIIAVDRLQVALGEGVSINDGFLHVEQGPLTIAGTLARLQNAGAIQSADGDLSLVLGSIENNGEIVASAQATLHALVVLQNTGLVQARDLSLAAASLTNGGRDALIHAGASATVIVSGDLVNEAGAALLAVDSLDIDAGGTVTNDAGLVGAGTVAIEADADIVNRNGATIDGDRVVLEAGGDLRNTTGAAIQGADALTLDAGKDLVNDAADLLTDGALVIDAGGDITNASGAWIRGGGVTVSAGGALINRDAAAIDSGENLAVTVAGEITNSAAAIGAVGDVTLSGSSLVNADGAWIDATGDLGITTTNGGMRNDGASVIGAEVDIDVAGDLANTNGAVIDGRDVSVTASGDIANTAAAGLLADHDVQLRAGRDIVNDNGEIRGFGEGELHLDAGRDILARNGATLAGDDARLRAARDARNESGSAILARDIDMDAGGALHNRDADSIIFATGKVTLRGASLDNRDTAVIAGTDIRVDVDGNIVNADGAAIDGTHVAITAGNDLRNEGGAEISADGAIELRAGCNVDNMGSTIRAYGQAGASIAAGCGVTNVDAEISGHDIELIAGTDIRNLGGGNIVGENVDIAAAGAIENAGEGSVLAASDTLVISGASLDNQGKAVFQGGAVDIDVEGKLHNRDGASLLGVDEVTIDADSLVNESGAALQAGSDLQWMVAGDVVNRSGARLEAGRILEGTIGGSLTNEHAGSAIVGGFVDLKIDGELLNRDQALLQASDALSLSAQRLVNRNAKLLAGEVAEDGSMWIGDMELVSREDILNEQGGHIVATGSAWIDANGNIHNGDNARIAGNNLYLHAEGANADITNAATATIAATDRADLRAAGNLLNHGAITGDGVYLSAGSDLTNTGRVAAGDWLYGASLRFDNTASGRIEGKNDIELRMQAYTNVGDILTDGNALLAMLDNRDFTFGNTTRNPFAKGTFRLEARNILVALELQNSGDIQLIASGWIDNVDGILSGGSVVAQADGRIDNRTLIWAAEDVTLRGKDILNHGNAEIEASRDLLIDAKSTLVNRPTARIAAGRDAFIDAPLIVNEATWAGGAHIPEYEAGVGEGAASEATGDWGIWYRFSFGGLRDPQSTLTSVNRGVIEVGGDLHINKLAQKDKTATLDNDGQVLAGGNLLINGNIDNTGVVATLSIRDYLHAKSDVYFEAKQELTYAQRYYDSLYEALDDIFSSRKSWDFGVFDWKWHSYEIAKQMQATKGSPLFEKTMTGLFGPLWRTASYDDLILAWNVFEQGSRDPKMEFAADRGPEIAAGRSIVHDQHSGYVRNGLSGRQENNKALTVNIGGETVTTVEGNFDVTLNLGDLTQALDPSDIWKHLTREGNKKFRPATVPPVRDDIDWSQEPPLSVPKPVMPDFSIAKAGVDVVLDQVASAPVTRPSAPVSPVFETRIEFIDQSNFFGSDYFFKQVGYTTDRTVTVIGDNYFITELVSGQITQQVGSFLAVREQVTGAALVQRLMDNAGDEGPRLGLRVGIAPTPGQLSGLTQDIVWFVEQEVDGVKALVPTVYLASSTVADVQAQRQSGAATIAAGENVVLSANEQGLENNTGMIRAGKSMVLESKGEVRNSTRLGFRDGGLAAKEALVIDAVGDVTNEGARIEATDVSIATEGNFTDRGLMGYDDTGALRLKQRSRIRGGGADTEAAADADAAAPPAPLVVESENAAILAIKPEGNVPVAKASSNASKRVLTEGSDPLAQASPADAEPEPPEHKGSVSIRAKGNVTLTASDIAAQHVAIKAGKNLVSKAIHEVSSSFEREGTKSLLGSTQYEKKTSEANAVGSSIKGAKEGGSLSMQVGGDMLLQGGEYGADVGSIKAGGKLITTTSKDYKHVSEKTVTEGLVIEARAGVGGAGAAAGIGPGGAWAGVAVEGEETTSVSGGRPKQSGKQVLGETASLKIGWERVETVDETMSVKNRNAKLDFGSGVSIEAGGMVDIGGVDIAAIKGSGDDATLGIVRISGSEVISTKHEDVEKTSSYRKEQFAGLTASASSSIADAVDNTKRLADKAAKEGMEIDPALTAAQAAAEATKLAMNDLGAVNADIGFKQTETRSSSTTRSENINTITGHTSITSTKGDIDLKGVMIGGSGATVVLDSARDLRLASAQTKTEFSSSTESHSATVGIGASVAPTGAGVGVSAGYNGSLETSQGRSTSHDNTRITGSNVTLKARNDLAMRGANVEGGDVNLDIGGDMRIESVQDTHEENGTRAEWGLTVGAAVTTNGIVQGTVSAQGGYGTDWNNRAKVAEQSGIKAHGTLNAKVGGDLHLKGSHMTSAKPGEVSVGGTISSEAMRDRVDRDGNFLSVGAGTSRTGLASVNVQYEKSDREIYDATHNGTIAGATIKAAGGIQGPLNQDADKALVVHEDRKIAGNQIGVDIGLDDVKDGVKSVRNRVSNKPKSGGDNDLGPGGAYRPRDTQVVDVGAPKHDATNGPAFAGDAALPDVRLDIDNDLATAREDSTRPSRDSGIETIKPIGAADDARPDRGDGAPYEARGNLFIKKGNTEVLVERTPDGGLVELGGKGGGKDDPKANALQRKHATTPGLRDRQQKTAEKAASDGMRDNALYESAGPDRPVHVAVDRKRPNNAGAPTTSTPDGMRDNDLYESSGPLRDEASASEEPIYANIARDEPTYANVSGRDEPVYGNAAAVDSKDPVNANDTPRPGGSGNQHVVQADVHQPAEPSRDATGGGQARPTPPATKPKPVRPREQEGIVAAPANVVPVFHQKKDVVEKNGNLYVRKGNVDVLVQKVGDKYFEIKGLGGGMDPPSVASADTGAQGVQLRERKPTRQEGSSNRHGMVNDKADFRKAMFEPTDANPVASADVDTPKRPDADFAKDAAGVPLRAKPAKDAGNGNRLGMDKAEFRKGTYEPADAAAVGFGERTQPVRPKAAQAGTPSRDPSPTTPTPSSQVRLDELHAPFDQAKERREITEANERFARGYDRKKFNAEEREHLARWTSESEAYSTEVEGSKYKDEPTLALMRAIEKLPVYEGDAYRVAEMPGVTGGAIHEGDVLFSDRILSFSSSPEFVKSWARENKVFLKLTGGKLFDMAGIRGDQAEVVTKGLDTFTVNKIEMKDGKYYVSLSPKDANDSLTHGDAKWIHSGERLLPEGGRRNDGFIGVPVAKPKSPSDLARETVYDAPWDMDKTMDELGAKLADALPRQEGTTPDATPASHPKEAVIEKNGNFYVRKGNTEVLVQKVGDEYFEISGKGGGKDDPKKRGLHRQGALLDPPPLTRSNAIDEGAQSPGINNAGGNQMTVHADVHRPVVPATPAASAGAQGVEMRAPKPKVSSEHRHGRVIDHAERRKGMHVADGDAAAIQNDANNAARETVYDAPWDLDKTMDDLGSKLADVMHDSESTEGAPIFHPKDAVTEKNGNFYVRKGNTDVLVQKVGDQYVEINGKGSARNDRRGAADLRMSASGRVSYTPNKTGAAEIAAGRLKGMSAEEVAAAKDRRQQERAANALSVDLTSPSRGPKRMDRSGAVEPGMAEPGGMERAKGLLKGRTSDEVVADKTIRQMNRLAQHHEKATSAENNRILAERIFSEVRTAYEGGLKSDNKLQKGREPGDLDPASIALNDLADRNKSNRDNNIEVPHQDRLEITAANCGQLSDCAAKLAVEYGGHGEQWRVFHSPGKGKVPVTHAFTIIGKTHSAGEPNTGFDALDGRWVVDGWANIVAHAPEYADALQRKLLKWENDGKLIRIGDDDETYLHPTDPSVHEALFKSPVVRAQWPKPGHPNPWKHFTSTLGEAGTQPTSDDGAASNDVPIAHPGKDVVGKNGNLYVRKGNTDVLVQKVGDEYFEIGGKGGMRPGDIEHPSRLANRALKAFEVPLDDPMERAPSLDPETGEGAPELPQRRYGLDELPARVSDISLVDRASETRPVDSETGERNRRIAESVFRQVREDYQAGLKSSNKEYAPDPERSREIERVIESLRTRMAYNTWQKIDVPPERGGHRSQLRRTCALHGQACDRGGRTR